MVDPPPRFIEASAGATDELLEAYRDKIVVLLLGPAEEPHLQLRRIVRDRLAPSGYRLLIMEDLPPVRGERLHAKLERLLEAEKPTHFFIIVPKGSMARAPDVEFGYLMREFGSTKILNHVRFFLETGIDAEKALAAYEQELIGEVGVDFYKDAEQFVRRAARRIDNIVLRQFADRT